MAIYKGLLKLKNAGGGFDVIYPKTEAQLVTLNSGVTVEEQINLNIAAITAAQQAADAAQAAADAAQQSANQGNGAAEAAQQAADAAQAAADKAQETADQAVADAAKAQAAADKAQQDATQGIGDAADALAAAQAAQGTADQAVADAAAAQKAADDAQAAADEAQKDATLGLENAAKAQAAADAAQQAADKGIEDAAGALAAAQQAQQQADKGVQDAADALAAAQAAQKAADAAQESANQGIADAAAALGVANQGVADAAAAQQAANQGIADAAAALAAAQQAQADADKANNALKAIDDGKNKANGYVQLNSNGLVPAEFIPTEFKEIKIVDNIAGRDALVDKFVGLSVYVKDATADATVAKGGAYYIYDGANFVKTAEAESLDVVLNWNAIEGKPTTLAGYGITDAVNIDMLVDAPAANKVLKLDANGKLPADITGNAATANKLAAAVNIGINGADVVAAAVAFDGSQAINIPVVLSDTGVAAGTYTKVQVDAKGRVISASNLLPSDLPEVNWNVIVGRPNSAVADIDDAVAKKHAHANAAQLDKIGEVDGVMAYNNVKMATQAYAVDAANFAAEHVIMVSATEPTELRTNGLWVDISE